MTKDAVQVYGSEAFSDPEVAVIVPAHNKVQYLPDCLESIRRQTFTDWECIIVDDASPNGDSINALVEGMADARFRIVRHDRCKGPAAARNSGCRTARARFLLWVDEDDRLVPDCLEKLVYTMRQTAADAVCPQAISFGGERRIYGSRRLTLREVLRGSHPLPWGFLMKKSLWETLGGQDEDKRVIGREDHEWWIRAIANGAEVEILPEVLYEYRIPATENEEKTSLNYKTKLREVRTRKYIVEKHSSLYRRHRASRIAYIREAYLKEATVLSKAGACFAAAVRFWQACFISWQSQDLRRAVRETLRLVIGRRRTEQLLVMRRRWLGAAKVEP
jgi:glycosyltransferase involved in cell wall biosynthesis